MKKKNETFVLSFRYFWEKYFCKILEKESIRENVEWLDDDHNFPKGFTNSQYAAFRKIARRVYKEGTYKMTITNYQYFAVVILELKYARGWKKLTNYYHYTIGKRGKIEKSNMIF